MYFADIHSHALCSVDDGAASEERMYQMADTAYRDGIRFLCLTPHFHPGFYGNNTQASLEAFEKLADYCQKNCPQMKLFLGNELHYSHDCLSWLNEGHCRCLNDSRYVLVDFSAPVTYRELSAALKSLLNAGYLPILAHAERYPKISVKHLEALKQNGALLQLSTQAILGESGFHQKQKTKKILSLGLADFIATDAHDMQYRTPKMKQCYEYVSKKYSKTYADFLCHDHALDKILH